MNNKTLFISSAPFEGGAEKSLMTYLSETTATNQLLIVHSMVTLRPEIEQTHQVYRLPFAWFVKTNNPFLLIYFFVNWLYCAFRIYLIAKRHGVNAIFANTFKTFLFTLFTKVFFRLKLIVCLRDNIGALWQRRILFVSDQIIAISEHIQGQIDSNQTAEIIHPCIKKDAQRPNTIDPVKGGSQDQLTIAIIGQLAPWKGQLTFLKLAETFKSNDQVNFLIIGDDQSHTNKAYRNQVLQQAAALKNVKFLGHLPNVQQMLNGIDVLIHLAEEEPFGRVIVEAMLSRKTVIALKSGGIPEIIEDGKSGLLVDKSLALFQARKAILKLLKSPARRLALGKAAQKKAQQFTDMDGHIRQVNDLISAVHAR